ncbi:unnamed protein product [Prunus brigantina]
MQVRTIYNGLNTTRKTLIDAVAGGALMAKTQDEAYELLETMANNSYQWPSERAMPKKAGVHDVDVITAFTAQISTLSKQLGSLNVNAIQTPNVIYEFCAGSHSSADCNNGNPFSALEQVNQVGDFNHQRNNPYSDTYNPRWKTHPNFSWSNNQNTTLQNQAASIKNLEVQMGQLANVLTGREKGSLPSQTEVNPKNQEHVMAITLRNGRPIKTTVGDKNGRPTKWPTNSPSLSKYIYI